MSHLARGPASAGIDSQASAVGCRPDATRIPRHLTEGTA
jgi:hypothetical protein